MEQRIRIGEAGRVVIPASYRKALQVEPGDELIIRLDEGELRIFHQKKALEHIRNAVKHSKYTPEATDEFITFRKKDSGE